ncbi:MAG: 16S rRNA (adenine(1518)-N(6)/adenine(1519)-N(6))-dimethyltransferase RsmA [Rhodospirillaceae bacterium]|jgi:16S rRNA (adenine1518-N6/adenine1519-N6)-dimethyltransferase|nr:16S rRNA (adenine(1518)-N(6)/adenine(1519)-N(6))-dimethyltransferase RsmA [Rhodospirillaceae bacterium]MBT5667140.1 16S rRNA (adenine(1518)-N(6)/adenine(1519)-N(6))-dimethyltransferase RsmA [Rhodospirillaceae bacterium]MBT5811806.1 16S rRNA (adenine(1518)-N(6)/adenine(1519)-N(6))-dimethyltransferase RsmA [Rhodospirillaceae bacterium]
MTSLIADLPPLREVIARHDLAARKGLGQHFLLDLNLTRRIARAAGDLSTGTVFEIGPGPGGLTRALLMEGARRVVAIERDPRCIEALAELVEASEGRLEVIQGDARDVDLATLGAAPRRVVANLPYNVATPLLINWLTHANLYTSLTLMFQREVGDRIVAEPGSRTYGRLSVLANWRCRTERLLTLPARAFTPPPKVESTVVALTPRTPPPLDADIKCLEAVTAAAFGQRRKMLRSALKSLGVDTEALLTRAGVDPTSRAETIDIAGFTALAQGYAALMPDITAPDAAP